MNKTLIALAVASLAAPLAVQADTTLYGQVDARVTLVEDQDIDQNNGGVRIGVKSSNDLGNGLSSFSKIETNITLDGSGDAPSGTAGGLNIRKAYAGVKGGFGTVIIGRQDNPYAGVFKSDMFTQFSGSHQLGGWRVGKAVAYASPDMGGFNFVVGAALDGEGSDARGERAVNVIAASVNFSVAGFDTTLAIQNADYSLDAGNGEAAVESKSSLVGLGLQYATGPMTIALTAEKESEGTEDTHLDLAGKYSINDATSVGVSYSTLTEGTGAEAEVNRILLGLYHNLGKNTSTYVAVQARGGDDDADEGTDLSAGLKLTF